MHQVFNWSLWGGHSRSYVNLVSVISEQTDSFEFLAVGSGNLFCRMLELPHCRRLPWSLDPFEVEVQNSSVLITSEQFCQVILFCSDILCAESAIVTCVLGFCYFDWQLTAMYRCKGTALSLVKRLKKEIHMILSNDVITWQKTFRHPPIFNSSILECITPSLRYSPLSHSHKCDISMEFVSLSTKSFSLPRSKNGTCCSLLC